MNITTETTEQVVKKWAACPSNPPGPIQVNKFNKVLRNLNSEHSTHRELWGVKGGEEHESCMVSLFGVNRREDVTKVQAEIGERYGWTVSKANVNTIMADIEKAMPALIANRPTEDKRRTPEQDTAERQEQAKAREEQEAASQQKAREVAAKAGELRKLYPWAITPESHMRGSTRAAANCKLELSNRWPSVAFSVRSDYNSIRVEWYDGPTCAQVNEVAAKYKNGHFDGMTDSYEYDHSVEGEAISQVLGRVQYINTSRRYGPSVENDVAAMILALEGIDAQGRQPWEITLPRFEHDNAGTAARLVLEATEIPAGSKVIGVAWNEEPSANLPQGVYKLVLEQGKAEVGNSGGALGTVRRNLEHDGVEIAFNEKPSNDLRARLQAAGFRITRRPPWKWYKKYSEYAWTKACELAGVAKAEEPDQAGAYVQAQEDAFCDQQAAAIGA